ncbi:LLM class F420-dependent oxidoreductase [Nocardioides sp. AE5]|uniref:LLM class F420-dependent oxidoreductase n=1 Tax=Nocardioides sp. AE5 TaxID=2962573 RepID=UPI0028823A7A|nr:LLM class F420-dependent oxidoreductase [Nocardioides sp. AE5]MDT0203182.1 LLM class F420-dependent oxidoreductase [Nocardioides sp. AE5]
MRLGITTASYTANFEESVELLADYEAAGIELVAVPEAYSFDAVSQLGYIAARTRTMRLTSSIMQIYSRTPSLTAMTAAGLDYVSGGRFMLGMGASGPQVIEGFHGVPYHAPLARTREIIEICRSIWRRERLVHDGAHYQIPLPAERGTGLGKPLKLIDHPVRERIPISLAAIGPKNVALAAELAESWQPLFFHPQLASQVWEEPLQGGFSRRDPSLGALDVMLQVSFALGEPSPESLAAIRGQLALYIGGMGAAGRNFYHRLACRYGYQEEADEIQRLYLAGRKADAAQAVPEDLVRAVSLIGDEDEVRRQLDEFAAAGVTTLLLTPLAGDPARRLGDVRRLAQLARGSAAVTAPAG